MIIKDIKEAKKIFNKCKIKRTPTIVITPDAYKEATKEIDSSNHPEKIRTFDPERWYGMDVVVSDELPCTYIIK